MNSNKTSLKSQLIRLGLVVPLALVSVGAYADPTTVGYSSPEDQLNGEADFSKDPFVLPEGASTDLVAEDEAAKTLKTKLGNSQNLLGSYFVAGREAGVSLLDFNPAGVSDGAVSVQVGLGSASVVGYADQADAAAAAAEPPAARRGLTSTTPAKLADLTVSTQKIVLGTGVASSLNGSDKLVIGGFGGYGVLEFASKLREKLDKDGKVTNADDVKDYTASVAAKSSGFGGGIFATYQADEASPLGFSAKAKVRYTQLTHLFTTKEVVAKVEEDVEATENLDESKGSTKRVYYGYKNGAISADFDLGYAYQVAKVYSFPIVVKGNVKGTADYDKFANGDKDAKGVLFLKKSAGLTLSTALLDEKLSPFVNVTVSQRNPVKSYAQDFAGVPVKETDDFTKTIGVGLQYAFSDTIALAAGFQKVLVTPKAKDAKDKADDPLNQSGGEFGLVYRF